jgi:hypothetical protein
MQQKERKKQFKSNLEAENGAGVSHARRKKN